MYASHRDHVSAGEMNSRQAITIDEEDGCMVMDFHQQEVEQLSNCFRDTLSSAFEADHASRQQQLLFPHFLPPSSMFATENHDANTNQNNATLFPQDLLLLQQQYFQVQQLQRQIQEQERMMYQQQHLPGPTMQPQKRRTRRSATGGRRRRRLPTIFEENDVEEYYHRSDADDREKREMEDLLSRHASDRIQAQFGAPNMATIHEGGIQSPPPPSLGLIKPTPVRAAPKSPPRLIKPQARRMQLPTTIEPVTRPDGSPPPHYFTTSSKEQQPVFYQEDASDSGRHAMES